MPKRIPVGETPVDPVRSRLAGAVSSPVIRKSVPAAAEEIEEERTITQPLRAAASSCPQNTAPRDRLDVPRRIMVTAQEAERSQNLSALISVVGQWGEFESDNAGSLVVDGASGRPDQSGLKTRTRPESSGPGGPYGNDRLRSKTGRILAGGPQALVTIIYI